MTPGSTTTAYRILAEELRQAIVSGAILPNERLPTETWLARERGVSRQTVRQAFQSLVAESLVYRVRGRGSFAAPAGGHGPYLRSFGSIDDLLALSVDTELEVVEPLRLRTDASAAGRLQLSADQVAAAVTRRLHEGVVFSTTMVSMPPDIAKLISGAQDLTRRGSHSSATVISLLEQAGVAIAFAQQSVMSVSASPDIAALVECDDSSPVLRIDRVYFDQDGRAVELAVSHFHPDRYSYRLEIRRSPY